MIRRRQFITLLGGAAAAWPRVASGQQPKMPVIGFLHGSSLEPNAHLRAAYLRGLGEVGFIEGNNVTIEYRWAEGQYDRLSTLAADLVRRSVMVITAVGGVAPSLAAKEATKTIPIVFGSGADPIKLGLVSSLNRPGGNVTGVFFFASVMEAKRLGLLREFVPSATSIAVLVNPSYPNAENQTNEVRQAARVLNLEIHLLQASNGRDLEIAFARMAELRPDALLVCADPYFNSQRVNIVVQATRRAVPALYEQREFVEAGGMASYGTSLTDAYYQVGIYTGRVLKGEKPAELPVMQSVRFEFVINLKTAKVLGIEVPPSLSARANEVIE